ncbi:OsmC family protein [Nonomuraea indica]|uniref:OsmC family protein n=1 Tax=Nonomuraea indica TaxID=1581193 RepID=A0ABW8A7X0_9ACTN
MSDYLVQVRHADGLSLNITNGRTDLTTAWNPEDGSWLATELFLAGLGACMLATLMSYAQTNQIDVSGAGVRVTAESAARPMRMSRIDITYELPGHLTEAQVQSLVRAGDRCKVHNTMEHHPELVVRAETGAAPTGGQP